MRRECQCGQNNQITKIIQIPGKAMGLSVQAKSGYFRTETLKRDLLSVLEVIILRADNRGGEERGCNPPKMRSGKLRMTPRAPTLTGLSPAAQH